MRIVWIVEAVTLAHVGRSLALASSLFARGVKVELALGAASGAWPTAFPQHALTGIGARAFARALRLGHPVLSSDLLQRMIAADLALLRRLSPELVIGDFRLSLSVSARLLGIPYATLTNAYWSPDCALPLAMPVLPLSRVLPLALANWLFDIGKRVVLPLHCRPMNRALLERGLPPLGNDLRTVYSDADNMLFADIPGMFAMRAESPRQHYLGPILWSPQIPLPSWWKDLSRGRPLVYVTVGSSGDPAVLRRIVLALASLPLTIVVATAGSHALDDLREPDLWSAPYLPGDQIAAAAELVICNGGSMGCQQAFVAGAPVLGVTGNMDQFLNMAGVVAAGAGLQMRADRVSKSAVHGAVTQLLEDPRLRRAAQSLGQQMSSFDAGQRLFDLLPTLARRA